MATIEEKFIHEATHNGNFKRALRDKDRASISTTLDNLGVSAAHKGQILDAIVRVDWGDLSTLKARLGGSGTAGPDN